MSSFTVNQIVSVVGGKHKGRCGQVTAEVFIGGKGLTYAVRFNETRTENIKPEYLTNASDKQRSQFTNRNAWCALTPEAQANIEQATKPNLVEVPKQAAVA